MKERRNYPKVNWVELRREYVQSSITLRELAAKHGISFYTTAHRCKVEQWPMERELFSKRLAVGQVQPGEREPERELPSSRSARLREGLAEELQKDLHCVAKHPPKRLRDSKERQEVLSSVTRNAATVFGWGETSEASLLVRVDHGECDPNARHHIFVTPAAWKKLQSGGKIEGIDFSDPRAHVEVFTHGSYPTGKHLASPIVFGVDGKRYSAPVQAPNLPLPWTDAEIVPETPEH